MSDWLNISLCSASCGGGTSTNNSKTSNNAANGKNTIRILVIATLALRSTSERNERKPQML